MRSETNLALRALGASMVTLAVSVLALSSCFPGLVVSVHGGQ